MTKVKIFRKDGEYLGYDADDHAGYDEYGKDVVCAAVSVLTINTANSVESLAKDEVESSASDGHLTCRFPKGLSHDGKLLMDSLVLGLQSIEETYGKSFLTVEIEEV